MSVLPLARLRQYFVNCIIVLPCHETSYHASLGAVTTLLQTQSEIIFVHLLAISINPVLEDFGKIGCAEFQYLKGLSALSSICPKSDMKGLIRLGISHTANLILC